MSRMKNWSSLDALLLLFDFVVELKQRNDFSSILLEHLTLLALFAEILSSNAKHCERSLCFGMHAVYIS